MTFLPRTLLALLLTSVLSGAQAQQLFSSPQSAAEALIDALGTDKADATKLEQLLGADWQQYIPTDAIERKDVEAFLALYREAHHIQEDGQGQAHLLVGEVGWVLPLPLQKEAGGWHFDTQAAAEEIRVRRIGRNEASAIQAVRAYHDAQMDYAEVDRDDDGVLEYAQQFVSSDGLHDGLYWPDAPDTEQSPLGPLFGDELPDGQWHGYHYRILAAQGPSAPGGSYDYRLGDNMSRGFALVAWPAEYADSGVMSFMISHDGQVFEKDLGPDGGQIATAMQRFDPDSSWQEVGESEPSTAGTE
ncbi:DUF2950 domain-containing protein [Pseudomonas sp. GOM6]|uniref:DUF2950 domain-containing protein n=1 Tax=Pseudomonas sp. GOM6 TaxID=3036944 RepID=UPI002409C4B9|nr:DUF2950 domain-containing protein [Pseudomonas sp. GOM6]MDG1581412.1 DUF2950 domain-containing protein [Pseudomonas sp. GOM6]